MVRRRRSAVLLSLAACAFTVLLPGPAAFARPLAATEPACSPTGDTTVGGGWLLPTARMKRIFAVEARIGGNPPTIGRLLFINHITRQRLEGEVITYALITANSRHMDGFGEVNGQPATFQLTVTDGGEQGRLDNFDLTYETGAVVTTEDGFLGGGNIQIRPLCSSLVAQTSSQTAPVGS